MEPEIVTTIELIVPDWLLTCLRYDAHVYRVETVQDVIHIRLRQYYDYHEMIDIDDDGNIVPRAHVQGFL